ncbi:unnamed protein product [Thelazia callipaeda]|uniref:S1 motif domain-containing protein n=1 Tax=Thelazia callipaeda TaxID=103827 RepID=A0A0N5CUM5_THECL|nr:unnamed protein product [Thelazia callipaeda]
MSCEQWTIDEYVAREKGEDYRNHVNENNAAIVKTGLCKDVAQSLVQLFEDGCELPFIARYRRHLIGNATTDDLRHSMGAFKEAKMVKAKAKKLLERADAEIGEDNIRASVKNALARSMDINELNSLFEPFKKVKQGSLASRAAYSYSELNTSAKVEENTVHLLSHYLHHLEETQVLLQNLVESNNSLNIYLKVKSKLTKHAKNLKETDKDFVLLDNFKLYLDFEKNVRFVQPFQILALERASSKKIITWKIVVDDQVANFHPGKRLTFHSRHINLLQRAVQDSVKRFFIPSIERKVRKKLLDYAENSAIDCFAKNLRELMLTAPLKGNAVLAIDPGYVNGCKCALVDENGNLIETTIFYLRQSRFNSWLPDERAESVLEALASKIASLPLVIAIGNGTGSREVQTFIASLIQHSIYHLSVVSECGASVYSITELAAKELPVMDVNLRSAVSLARRVIDPISEYVKIAPKHLGIGLYQHSVNEKRLNEMLDIVVRECVSNVGVDVNVASLQVLQKVSGLNKRTAASIIKYRQDNGLIKSREELKCINGIGLKCFEQCAGFLYVYEPNKPYEIVRKKAKLSANYNPLDATRVHPESYEIAMQLLKYANIDLSYVGQACFPKMLSKIEQQVQKKDQKWSMVWELLVHPFVRKNSPKLLTSVLEMKSLKKGDILEGVVRNYVQFGIFIDIGINFNALAHSSTFSSVLPELLVGGYVNSTVKVKITDIDINKRRINVIIL